MNGLKRILVGFCITYGFLAAAQEDVDKSWRLTLLAGGVNYQGDLQPNSFSFAHAGYISQIGLRKSFNNRISTKIGFGFGKFGAADQNNKDYLQARNLSFRTSIKELSLDFDLSLFDLFHTRFTPYVNGSVIAFHFNPYVIDQNGERVYLKPLSTEGQGLPEYPDRKPYKLLQFAVGFGGGLRFMASENLIIKMEATQRKTFTDYLDDVSTTYVDGNRLALAKGNKAVEYAFRGDELNNGQIYPPDGEQRGTPKEMDWYYYIGIGVELKFASLSGLFTGNKRNKDYYNSRCPTVY